MGIYNPQQVPLEVVDFLMLIRRGGIGNYYKYTWNKLRQANQIIDGLACHRFYHTKFSNQDKRNDSMGSHPDHIGKL